MHNHNFHQHQHHDKSTHDEIHVANHEHCSSRHFHDVKEHRTHGRKMLTIIMIVTLLFSFVEFAGGWISGSLALISDAFHMLTDSSSLFIALIMAIMAQKPADKLYSYGHGRWEIVGALINGLFMVFVIAFLLYESVNRIINPQPVQSVIIMGVAAVGLLVNIFAAFMLKDSHSLNTKAALIHVMGDLLGSVAALLAGVIIYFTGMTIFDPIISILVSIILVFPTYSLLKKTFRIILEGVPEHIDYETVGEDIAAIKGVLSIHDLHIWSMTSDHVSLSSHIEIKTAEEWHDILAAIQIMLSNKHGIHHVTLQPELED